MLRRFGSKRRAVLAAGVVCVLGVVGVGYAFGAIPGTGGVIQGCYDSGGNLKVVNALPCPKNSTALSWNQTGPTGATGETGATGATGPPGPSNLAALQGSPCTVNARPSSLDVSVDSTSGAVSMVCTPVYEVKATVTGGTMDLIRITDYTSQRVDHDFFDVSTSASYLLPKGRFVAVGFEDGSHSLGGGRSFTYTCPDGVVYSAEAHTSGNGGTYYDGDNCHVDHLNADFEVSSTFD
jgi:hypothetical protein